MNQKFIPQVVELDDMSDSRWFYDSNDVCATDKKRFQVLERANKFVAIFRWPTTLYFVK